MAGLLRIDWHALRYAHGTLLHAQGTALKVAQAQLGHSRMTTTGRIHAHQCECAEGCRCTTRKTIVPKLGEEEKNAGVKPAHYQ
jgi:hypothetical protein